MNYFLHPSAPGRVAVAYRVPGLDAACAISDYPIASRHLAQAEVNRLSAVIDLPYIAPENRAIPSGFYADQGALF